MRADRVLQATSNVVAGLVGLLVGLALSGFSGIQAWLLTWQTLLTGILAVAAAG